jgi:hypothetical protein
MRNKGANQDDISPRQRYHLRLAGGAAAWVAAATLDAVAVVNLRKPPRKSRCRAWTPSTAHPLGRRWYCSFRLATLVRRHALLASILVVMSHVPALAQGCTSCYTTAVAGGPQTAHALRSGILVLLIPPMLIFSCIVFLLRRWRTAGSTALIFGPSEILRGASGSSGTDESCIVPERELAP